MGIDRHVIAALLVAPVLALLAWFAVGSLDGEKARPARAGAAYPLLEKSNCRYESGACDLENADFKARLMFSDSSRGHRADNFPADFAGASRADFADDRPPKAGARLDLYASHALDSVLVSLARAHGDAAPSAMIPVDREGRRWQLELERRPDPGQRLRLVLSRRGTAYFAEASTAFLHTETP